MLLKLVRDFPKNRIIVFSQTVFYQNRDMLCHDFEMLRNHGNLFFVHVIIILMRLLSRF